MKNQLQIRISMHLILSGLNFELNEVISPKEIAPYEVWGIKFKTQDNPERVEPLAVQPFQGCYVQSFLPPVAPVVIHS